MNGSDAPKVRIVEATVNDSGQRIDNFLAKHLKGVPRNRIYRALRKGEVRVNGSRKKPTYQIATGDRVRIPPIRHREVSGDMVIPGRLLEHVPVLFEDEHIMVVNKPSGLAVHGGSGMDYGLIEAMRQLGDCNGFLELVHRLDRETSGCLMLAKSRQALVNLQQQLAKQRSVRKHYLALVFGKLTPDRLEVTKKLKQVRDSDGIKRMKIDASGQPAHTVFRVKESFGESTLVQADLLTGRMHQARTHAMGIGHAIAGDRVYGDRDFNNAVRKFGLGRLFLHAERLRIVHPIAGRQQDFLAPMPESLTSVLDKLRRGIKFDI